MIHDTYKVVMIDSESELSAVANQYNPGVIAHLPGYTRAWQFGSSGWVEIFNYSATGTGGSGSLPLSPLVVVTEIEEE